MLELEETKSCIRESLKSRNKSCMITNSLKNDEVSMVFYVRNSSKMNLLTR